jgi:hypothetical protein
MWAPALAVIAAFLLRLNFDLMWAIALLVAGFMVLFS